MEFPFVDKLEDIDEEKLKALLVQFEKEDELEGKKVLVLDKFHKLNSEHHKAVEELKSAPNHRRFRQLRKSYVQQLLEIHQEYKKISI